MNAAYVKGFMDKCAQMEVDPEKLITEEQKATDQPGVVSTFGNVQMAPNESSWTSTPAVNPFRKAMRKATGFLNQLTPNQARPTVGQHAIGIRG